MGAVDTVEAEVRELVRRRGLDPVADRAVVRRLVDEVVADYDERALTSSLVPLQDRDGAVRLVYDAVAGFGPLQRHLDDPTVEEIWINEPGRVFVAHAGRSELTTTILSDAQVRDLVEKMLKSSGRRIDMSSPFVDAMLPDGSRLHVVIPDITRSHWSVNIRKFVLTAGSLDELVSLGTLTGQAARFLEAAVVAGLKVIVAGGTQAGKNRIVRGESLRSIVADLNARAVPSPTGKPWGKTMLRHLVARERNVGLRVHHGQVVGSGEWPPILERPLWEQVRAILTDPARKTSTSSAAVHLLSGIARCGVCGGPMRAGMNRHTPSYRCADRSCVSRNRADLDAFVTAVVLERLRRPDVVALLAPADDSTRRAVAEAAELRARLDNAADDYADGTLDREQFHRITERLRPRLEAAQARARVVDTSPLLEGLAGAPDAGEVWDQLPLPRRRAVVDLLVTVTVFRAQQGARVFDPRAVRIEWKADA